MKNKKKLLLSISSFLSLSIPLFLVSSCFDKKESSRNTDPLFAMASILKNKHDISKDKISTFILSYNAYYANKDKGFNLSLSDSRTFLNQLSSAFDSLMKYRFNDIIVVANENYPQIDLDNKDYQRVSFIMQRDGLKTNVSFDLKIVSSENQVSDPNNALNSKSSLFKSKDVILDDNLSSLFVKYNNIFSETKNGDIISKEDKKHLLELFATIYDWEFDVNKQFEDITIFSNDFSNINLNLNEKKQNIISFGMKINDMYQQNVKFAITSIPSSVIRKQVAFYESPVIRTVGSTAVNFLIKEDTINTKYENQEIDLSVLPSSLQEAEEVGSQYWIDYSTFKLDIVDGINKSNLQTQGTNKKNNISFSDKIKINKTGIQKIKFTFTVDNLLGLNNLVVDDLAMDIRVIDQPYIDNTSSTESIVYAGYDYNPQESNFILSEKEITIPEDFSLLESGKTKTIKYKLDLSNNPVEQNLILNYFYLQQYHFTINKNITSTKNIIIPGIKVKVPENRSLEVSIQNKNIFFQPGFNLINSKNISDSDKSNYGLHFTGDSNSIHINGGSFYGNESENGGAVYIESNNISFINSKIDGRSYSNMNSDEIFESIRIDGKKNKNTGINRISITNSFITNGKIVFINQLGKFNEDQTHNMLFSSNLINYSPIDVIDYDINNPNSNLKILALPQFKLNLFTSYDDEYSAENSFYYFKFNHNNNEDSKFLVSSLGVDVIDNKNTFSDPNEFKKQDLVPLYFDENQLWVFNFYENEDDIIDKNNPNSYIYLDGFKDKSKDNYKKEISEINKAIKSNWYNILNISFSKDLLDIKDSNNNTITLGSAQSYLNFIQLILEKKITSFQARPVVYSKYTVFHK